MRIHIPFRSDGLQPGDLAGLLRRVIMARRYYFELQISDYIGEKFFEHGDLEYRVNIINFFQRQLEEVIGGMLCITHFAVPEILPLINFDDFTSIRIECCCADQCSLVGDRIKLLLKEK